MARRSRFAWLLGGSVFSVALLAWGTLNIFDLVAHQRTHVHMDVPSHVAAVEAHLGNGSIQVVGTDAATASVDATVSRGLRPTHHSEQVVGDRLVVRSSCPSPFDTWCGVDYRVSVPRDVTLSISSDDASVTIANVSGDLDVSTSDGSINVDGPRRGLRLHSSDGNITATDSQSPTAEVTSGDGSVNLTFSASPSDVAVRTGDGNATVVVPDTPGAYRVTTSTGDGGVSSSIRTDPSAPRTIAVSTGDGSISIHYPAH
jgi:hypothetical protein